MKDKIFKISDNFGLFLTQAIIFLIPLFFAFKPWVFNIFELPKQVLFRILVVLLLIFYSVIFLKKGKIELKGGALLTSSVLGLLFSGVMAAIFSMNFNLSFWGDFHRQQGVVSLVFYLVFFCLLFLSVKNKQDIYLLIKTAVLSSALVCFYGILQFFGVDLWQWFEPASETGRIFSSLGQPNFLGHFLVIVFPLSFFTFLFLTKNIKEKIFFLLVLFFEIIALILTYSRTAWVAMMFSLLFIFLFYLNRHQKKKKIITGLFIVVPVIFLLFLVFSGIFSNNGLNPFSRAKNMFDLGFGSGKARVNYWTSAWGAYRSASTGEKVFGFGQETQKDILPQRYDSSWMFDEKIYLFPDRAHNFILDTLLTTGLFGLVAFSFLILQIIWRSLKMLGKTDLRDSWLIVCCLISLLAYFVNDLGSFSLTSHYVYFYFILFILAWLIETKTRFLILDNGPLRYSFFWIGLFFSLVAIHYCAVRPVIADTYYLKSEKSAISKNWSGVLVNNLKAINTYPQESFYKRGFLDNINDFLSESRDKTVAMELEKPFLGVVEQIDDDNAGLLLGASLAESRALFAYFTGKEYYYEQAEFGIRELLKKYPGISYLYATLARIKLSRGDFDEAILFTQGALNNLADPDGRFSGNHRQELIKETVQDLELMALIYETKNESEQALDYYKKISELDPGNERSKVKIKELSGSLEFE